MKEGNHFLKQAAAGTGVNMGTVIDDTSLKAGGNYGKTAFQHYDSIRAENACTMAMIADTWEPEGWDYEHCKFNEELAFTNNVKFRGHNLICGDFHPEFMEEHTNSTQELAWFLKTYITHTLHEMGDYAYVWDVVQSSISDSDQLEVTNKKRPWQNYDKEGDPWHLVPDHICLAFYTARKANPTALLFYTDYHVFLKDGWQEIKSRRVFEAIKDIKKRNCGIDGIGLSVSVSIEFDEFESLRANIQRYAKLGILVHLIDVSVRGMETEEHHLDLEFEEDNEPTIEWTPTNLQKQANVFSGLLKVCLEEPNCTSFETEGHTDRYSHHARQQPLPFDKYYSPKVAHEQMYQTLLNFPRDHAAVLKRTEKNGNEKG